MITFEARHNFPQPAHQVWQTLGDFAALADWLPGVQQCQTTGTGIGATRRVTNAKGEDVVEELTRLDNQRMEFDYRIIEAPGFTASMNYSATVIVSPNDDGCEVRWCGRLDVDRLPEEIANMVRDRTLKLYHGALQALEQKLA